MKKNNVSQQSKVKKKYFVSFVIGYFPALHQFAPYQNFYLYPLLVAKEMGYAPVLIIKEGMLEAQTDPNLEPSIVLIEYSGFIHFLFILTKYAAKNAVFYINNHQPLSYFALIYTKLLGQNNIFMGHIQPKRTSKFRQFVFDCVLLFTTRVRLNNSNEVKFLQQRGLSEAKLFIAPIAISPKSFSLTETDYSKRRDIVYYGNTTAQKGIPTLLSALEQVIKQFPEIKLHIVGSRGNYDPNPDIKRLGLEQSVVQHGAYRHGSELNQLLNQFLVFVLDTKAEGQCMAVYEAALAGNALCLPLIMSFDGIFENKALLHPLGDSEVLAHNIIIYLKDIDLIKKHNELCRNMTVEVYSESVVKAALVKLLRF
jgi:glycosyltransferase involved in cell wall biosynthesis